MSGRSRGAVRLALVVVALVVMAGCSAGSKVELPPTSAGPDVVLDTYLRALVAGDCESARQLATATFTVGNGDLCGQTTVSAYEVNPTPAGTGAETVFSTTLTTSGTGDGSIAAGRLTWFFTLDQQPDGAWRLAGGGTGP